MPEKIISSMIMMELESKKVVDANFGDIT